LEDLGVDGVEILKWILKIGIKSILKSRKRGLCIGFIQLGLMISGSVLKTRKEDSSSVKWGQIY
jgi:hypothetical protein